MDVDEKYSFCASLEPSHRSELPRWKIIIQLGWGGRDGACSLCFQEQSSPSPSYTAADPINLIPLLFYFRWRAWRFRWEQVPDVAGFARCRHGELRGQHRREEPLHYFRQGDQGPAESPPFCLRRRHGDGHCQEGEARSEEEGHARSHRQAAEAVAQKGRRVHVFWRYFCSLSFLLIPLLPTRAAIGF